MKKRKLFVGGLKWAMDDAGLKRLFEEGDTGSDSDADSGYESATGSGTAGCGLGTVETASVVRDRDTGKSRGFAFVTMTSVEKAAEAIKKFNNTLHEGRTLKVDEASDPVNTRRDEGGSQRRTGNYSGGFSSDYSFNKKKKEY